MDGSKDNNHYTNLAWVSPKENTAHKRRHGTHLEGEKASNVRLTKLQVVDIKGLLGTMPQTEIAKRFGVHPCTIHDIKKGKSWKSVDQGRAA